MGLWMFKEFVNPQYEKQTKADYETRSDSYLLRKMRSKVPFQVDVAEFVLRQRGNKEAVTVLLDLINSRDEEIRRGAFQSLAFWKDERILPVLESFVKQGRGNRDYLNALDALSFQHDESIYPDILQAAKDNYNTPLIVDMLERFPEKPGTLSALRNIAEGDTQNYVRENARRVIAKIESAQVKPAATKAAK
jgi:HEAT repeat protein